jgi:chloramphenicol O-acetyltransferase
MAWSLAHLTAIKVLPLCTDFMNRYYAVLNHVYRLDFFLAFWLFCVFDIIQDHEETRLECLKQSVFGKIF